MSQAVIDLTSSEVLPSEQELKAEQDTSVATLLKSKQEQDKVAEATIQKDVQRLKDTGKLIAVSELKEEKLVLITFKQDNVYETLRVYEDSDMSFTNKYRSEEGWEEWQERGLFNAFMCKLKALLTLKRIYTEIQVNGEECYSEVGIEDIRLHLTNGNPFQLVARIITEEGDLFQSDDPIRPEKRLPEFAPTSGRLDVKITFNEDNPNDMLVKQQVLTRQNRMLRSELCRLKKRQRPEEEGGQPQEPSKRRRVMKVHLHPRASSVASTHESDASDQE
jgi:hypothetical protein